MGDDFRPFRCRDLLGAADVYPVDSSKFLPEISNSLDEILPLCFCGADAGRV